MLLRVSSLVLGTGALVASPLLLAQAPAPKKDVAKVWTEVCASCHGANMQGAQAPSMLDDTWISGNGDDAALAATIKNGRLDKGMPAFSNLLTDEEIRAMVVYIRETAGKAKAAGAGYAAPQPNVVVQSEKHTFKLETVVEGVNTPWGVDFLPDGRMLIAEKGGTLRLADAKGTLAAEPIQGVPAVWAKGQGGLLDVIAHPDYARNGWVYLSYADKTGRDPYASTTVLRATLRDGELQDQKTVFSVPTAKRQHSGHHFGSRFAFVGNDLYFTIGDAGRQDNAQDLTVPTGKVHRIRDDGSIPADNPFVSNSSVSKNDAWPSIWTWGNRNPQGLVYDAVGKRLWAAEHGPRGGDEINLIEKGKNYGWPVITYGMNYNGTPISDKTHQDGMEQPKHYWTPSIAVSNIDIYRQCNSAVVNITSSGTAYRRRLDRCKSAAATVSRTSSPIRSDDASGDGNHSSVDDDVCRPNNCAPQP